MTIDLNMMIDLRDMQVALDVAQRAELGWFDIEFTMYGCAYWKDGKRYYQLSAYNEKIYDFQSNSAQNGVLSSELCTLTRKYPVPTGMREYIALEVKKELAQEMARKFPADFFRCLEEWAIAATEDTAMPFLQQQWQEVSCTFDLEKLRLFKEMVEYAYLNRKLSADSYRKMQELIHDEQKSMEENFIAKDIFEKTFYGIVYMNKNGLKYAINARSGNIYQKKAELELQGIFTSPVFSKTYYYNYDLRLPDVHKFFERDLKQYMTAAHLERLKEIYTHNEKVSKEQFNGYKQETAEKYGEAATETLCHYGYRWGILW